MIWQIWIKHGESFDMNSILHLSRSRNLNKNINVEKSLLIARTKQDSLLCIWSFTASLKIRSCPYWVSLSQFTPINHLPPQTYKHTIDANVQCDSRYRHQTYLSCHTAPTLLCKELSDLCHINYDNDTILDRGWNVLKKRKVATKSIFFGITWWLRISTEKREKDSSEGRSTDQCVVLTGMHY